MSLVVFPFKTEDPEVVRRNFDRAAAHDRVGEVWGVAAAEGVALERARAAAEQVSAARGKPVIVFAQQRLGTFRSGKGDGMNTALGLAADREFERIHFYDADITNFGAKWIDRAESAADAGHEIVRHRFPRASTDAMITWMITRPALAMLFPGTILPRLGQPLGGELLISGRVARALADDRFVTARSDWGIDTILTHATAAMGAPLHESEITEGKRHALYGSLDELRPMVVECLDASRSLAGRPRPPDGAVFSVDPPGEVPEDLKHVVGYDLDRTVGLLVDGWSDAESALAQSLPGALVGDVLRNRATPNYEFMDADRWWSVLTWLLEDFRLGDPAWEALTFRLWLMRVLAYTTRHVPAGYDEATGYLERTIRSYEELARRRRAAPGT